MVLQMTLTEDSLKGPVKEDILWTLVNSLALWTKHLDK